MEFEKYKIHHKKITKIIKYKASVCVSIQSMMSSNDKLERPIDNERYVRHYGGRSPKDTKWYLIINNKKEKNNIKKEKIFY